MKPYIHTQYLVLTVIIQHRRSNQTSPSLCDAYLFFLSRAVYHFHSLSFNDKQGLCCYSPVWLFIRSKLFSIGLGIPYKPGCDNGVHLIQYILQEYLSLLRGGFNIHVLPLAARLDRREWRDKTESRRFFNHSQSLAFLWSLMAAACSAFLFLSVATFISCFFLVIFFFPLRSTNKHGLHAHGQCLGTDKHIF